MTRSRQTGPCAPARAPKQAGPESQAHCAVFRRFAAGLGELIARRRQGEAHA